MNFTKVRKTASNVNYVKPELEMVEIEIENSLLLTASAGGSFKSGGGTGKVQVNDGGYFTTSRRN